MIIRLKLMGILSSQQLDVMVPTCAETEKIHMRKYVVTSIVESERMYLVILDTLMQVLANVTYFNALLIFRHFRTKSYLNIYHTHHHPFI